MLPGFFIPDFRLTANEKRRYTFLMDALDDLVPVISRNHARIVAGIDLNQPVGFRLA